jgi:hypothetical protein
MSGKDEAEAHLCHMQDVLDSLEEGFAGRQTDAKEFLNEVTGLIFAVFFSIFFFRKRGLVFLFLERVLILNLFYRRQGRGTGPTAPAAPGAVPDKQHGRARGARSPSRAPSRPMGHLHVAVHG